VISARTELLDNLLAGLTAGKTAEGVRERTKGSPVADNFS